MRKRNRRRYRSDTGETHSGLPSRRPEAGGPDSVGRDEIEYLREGGNIRGQRKDMETIGNGSYRTYSHNFDQDGDNDFDSSYGDNEKLYSDGGAQDRFLRGEGEDNGYGSRPPSNPPSQTQPMSSAPEEQRRPARRPRRA